MIKSYLQNADLKNWSREGNRYKNQMKLDMMVNFSNSFTQELEGERIQRDPVWKQPKLQGNK